MTEAVERIKAELDGMSEDERMDVAEYLVGLAHSNGDADESDDPDFDAMLERRSEEIRTGKVVGRPAFEFLDELRRKYLG